MRKSLNSGGPGQVRRGEVRKRWKDETLRSSTNNPLSPYLHPPYTLPTPFLHHTVNPLTPHLHPTFTPPSPYLLSTYSRFSWPSFQSLRALH